MSDTIRKITLDFESGRRIVTWTRVHSLGLALESVGSRYLGNDFYGSCQITVEPDQLENAGPVYDSDEQPVKPVKLTTATADGGWQHFDRVSLLTRPPSR